MGYSPANSAGDILILQFPRQPAAIQIDDGKIDVQYDSTPPPPGQSHRGIECLLRLSGGAPIQCT